MKDFFAFRTMLVPAFIQVFSILGYLILVFIGIAMIFSANSSMAAYSDPSDVQLKMISGLLCATVGPLMLRMVCEVLIVFFRINETLTEIKNAIAKN